VVITSDKPQFRRSPSKKVANWFSKVLMRWDEQNNNRPMPWKGEKDPYKVWLSEVILQQTRVEQGVKYYQDFIAAFPNVYALASTPEQKVFKLWEGLGYYNRCRNLIDTANHLVNNLNGKFPDRYEDIKKLKGIGPYTAAAIASFAFNEPRAVVDGNVFRVLSRIFGFDTPIDTFEGKKLFTALANDLISTQEPALFNQAIMDFGAVVCKPVPNCKLCPFNGYCTALHNNDVVRLPIKTKKVIIQRRWFNYIIMEYRGKLAIRQRTKKDIWHNLFEFLLIESRPRISTDAVLKEIKKEGWLGQNSFEVKSVSPIFSQQLSHQRIEGRFTRLKVNQKHTLSNEVLWIRKNDIKQFPFPKFINQYLEQEHSLIK
jgi:A/G-specific adenine glycosylase